MRARTGTDNFAALKRLVKFGEERVRDRLKNAQAEPQEPDTGE
jgi:hypothetical protein